MLANISSMVLPLRRRFLQTAAAIAAVPIAPGLRAQPVGKPIVVGCDANLQASGFIAAISRVLGRDTGLSPTWLPGPSRSLLPDAFNLPGYALLAIAMYALLSSRRARSSDTGELLDGIMLGAGALLIVNQLIIVPSLDIDGTWVMARLSVSIYPAIDDTIETVDLYNVKMAAALVLGAVANLVVTT